MRSPAVVQLASDELAVDVDPRRGADLLQIRHLPTDSTVLFETPWCDTAEAVRSGARPAVSADSFGRWLEGDRGGWQVLCPNAGAQRDVAGGVVGFHGEAALVPWTVVGHDSASVDLTVRLFSVPVRIDRTVRIVADEVSVTDTLTNESPAHVGFDYSAHPSLGGDLLAGPCRLDTNADTFVADSLAPGANLRPGGSHRWPLVTDRDGVETDLRDVPAPGARRSLLGWLTGFDGAAWATVTAVDRDLGVRLCWDPTVLPKAWLWQELGGMAGFPWFGRARALAVEPASTVTSGPGRHLTLDLAPDAHVTARVSVTVGRRDRVVSPRGPGGTS